MLPPAARKFPAGLKSHQMSRSDTAIWWLEDLDKDWDKWWCLLIVEWKPGHYGKQLNNIKGLWKIEHSHDAKQGSDWADWLI